MFTGADPLADENEVNVVCQPACSFQRNLLALSLRYFDEIEGCEFNRFMLPDIVSDHDDAETDYHHDPIRNGSLRCYPQLSGEINRYAQPSAPIFSYDGSMIAWEDLLYFNKQAASAIELESEDLVMPEATSFSRPGQYLGYTAINFESGITSAVVTDTALTAVQVRIENARFAAFFSTEQHWVMVVTEGGSPVTQVWDLLQQAHLHSVAVSPQDVGPTPLPVPE